MNANTDEMLTVSELMNFLKIGRTKAYEIIRIKGFPLLSIGGVYRISKSDLMAWLSANTVN